VLNKERSFKDIKFRIERLVLKNLFWFIAIFFLVVLYQSSRMGEIADAQDGIRKEMEMQRNSYVALDSQGIPISLPRTYVGAENNQAIVAEALKKLIVSRANITDNFKVSKFEKVTDIASNSQSLTTFANEYIILHQNLLSNLEIKTEEWERIKEENQKGIRYFRAYLQYLHEQLMEDKLPHKITIIDYDVINYTYDGNSFQIQMRVQEIVDRYAGQTQDGKVIWDSKKGYSTITARGFFDIRLRTKRNEELGLKGINTKGLRFNYLNIIYAM